MKSSTLKYLLFIFIIVIFNNCTIKDISIDPLTGEKKSLVIISPNYLTTRIQVRLRDIDSKAFIKNDMKVKVYSNKKVIDFGGHYKNEFTVKNGVLNFAIDPNEDISEVAPLSLRIVSSSTDPLNTSSAYLPARSNLTLSSPGSKVVLLQHTKFSSINAQSYSGVKPLSFSSIPFYLTVDGTKNNLGWNKSNGILSALIMHQDPDFYEVEYLDYFWYNLYLSHNVSHTFKVNYNPGVDYDMTDYQADFDYDSYTSRNQYTVYKSGKTSFKDLNNRTRESKIQPFDGNIVISDMALLNSLNVKVYKNDIGTCPAGYSFSFSGLGNNGTQLEYALSRKNINDERFYTNIGIANLNGMLSANPKESTEQNILFGKLSNSVTFLPNSQYTVEPSTMELGDSTSCGKTFNFKLVPKVDLTKYKIILKAGCSGKSISITPSLNLLFKNSVLDDLHFEGVEFISGSANLYLTPKGDYNFQGEYNGKNFNFNISTDFTNLVKMRLSTLAANPDLKDLMYSNMMTVNGVHMMTVNMTFSQATCPF